MYYRGFMRFFFYSCYLITVLFCFVFALTSRWMHTKAACWWVEKHDKFYIKGLLFWVLSHVSHTWCPAAWLRLPSSSANNEFGVLTHLGHVSSPARRILSRTAALVIAPGDNFHRVGLQSVLRGLRRQRAEQAGRGGNFSHLLAPCPGHQATARVISLKRGRITPPVSK